jgi:hypothetical protein
MVTVDNKKESRVEKRHRPDRQIPLQLSTPNYKILTQLVFDIENLHTARIRYRKPTHSSYAACKIPNLHNGGPSRNFDPHRNFGQGKPSNPPASPSAPSPLASSPQHLICWSNSSLNRSAVRVSIGNPSSLH